MPRRSADRRVTHAGPSDIRGGEAYRPIANPSALYAVDRVFFKAGVWTVVYYVRGGDFDGCCCEAPLKEFCERVKP